MSISWSISWTSRHFVSFRGKPLCNRKPPNYSVKILKKSYHWQKKINNKCSLRCTPQKSTEWCNQGMVVGEKKRSLFPVIFLWVVSRGWRPGACTCVTSSRCKVIEGSSCFDGSFDEKFFMLLNWGLYFLEKLWQHFQFFSLAFCLSNCPWKGL